MQDRALYRDGCWNTLCLPFSLNDFTGTPLENADVRELYDASLDGTTLTLNFSSVYAIEAGKPYIVKCPSDADIVNPVFTGVVIDTDQLTDADFGTVSFKGTYSHITFTDENQDILFLGDDNTLHYPISGAFIGAQHAYFQLASGAAANNFVLNFDDDDASPTAIASEEISNFNSQISNVFDLQGRKINVQSSILNAEGVASGQRERSGNSQLPKGIYIRGRKKIIY